MTYPWSPSTHLDQVRWAAQVSNYLARATACPGPARSAGLAFRIDPDGLISDIRVAHSSGDGEVDRRAVGRLRAIGRVPAGPIGAQPRTHFAMIALTAPQARTAPARKTLGLQYA